MLAIRCKIHITNRATGRRFSIGYCNEIEIDHNLDRPASTARIVLPRKLQFQGETITGRNDSYFGVGDYVRIDLGYQGVLGGGTQAKMRKNVFTGYISKVHPKAPIELELVNDFWRLMRIDATEYIDQELEDVDLTSVAKRALVNANNELGTNFQLRIVPEGLKVNINKITIERRVSVYALLEQMAQDYGLDLLFNPPNEVVLGQIYLGSYWRSVLEGSAISQPKITTTADIIDDGLEYQKAEDTLIKVIGKSYVQSTGETLTVEGGDSAGDTRTVFFLNLRHDELIRAVEDQAQKLKYTGYSGSMTIFGEPYLRIGQAIRLRDSYQMKPEGRYLVKSVRHRFGDGIGWRQDVELDREI